MLILIEERQTYGFEMMEELKKHLREEGYKPPQSEIYRGLDELVKAYKAELREELTRCLGILNVAVTDNFK